MSSAETAAILSRERWVNPGSASPVYNGLNLVIIVLADAPAPNNVEPSADNADFKVMPT